MVMNANFNEEQHISDLARVFGWRIAFAASNSPPKRVDSP